MDAWLDWLRSGLDRQRSKHALTVDQLKARILALERQLAER